MHVRVVAELLAGEGMREPFRCTRLESSDVPNVARQLKSGPFHFSTLSLRLHSRHDQTRFVLIRSQRQASSKTLYHFTCTVDLLCK